MSVLKAFMEVEDLGKAEMIANAEVLDPAGDLIAKRDEARHHIVSQSEVERCFAQAVQTCEKKMISFLEDPFVQRRLIRDLPLFSQED
jgi:hypothetical protein